MNIKSLILIAGCACTMLAFVACSNNSSSQAETKETKAKATFTNVQPVPLSEATSAIHAYGEWWRAKGLPDSSIENITRAFLIPGNDLVGVLDPANGSSNIIAECKYKQARAYLGLDVNNAIHLYLTPVDEQGRDVILTNPATGDQEVFDLTTPCPRTCDATSQLYTAFN
jgi:hypothetical protein